MSPDNPVAKLTCINARILKIADHVLSSKSKKRRSRCRILLEIHRLNSLTNRDGKFGS